MSSVERRLAERLSLDASDVESGELRSMDEAMSVSVIKYTYKFYLTIMMRSLTSSIRVRRAGGMSHSALRLLH